MQESLPPEHGRKLFRYTFKKLLDGRGVPNERRAHLETAWWNVADGRFHVVWNPVNEVAGVFVLYVQHLFVYLFHRHATSVNF